MNGPGSSAAFHADMALPPLLVQRDPATAPNEDRLVETALHWITVARNPALSCRAGHSTPQRRAKEETDQGRAIE